MNAEQVRALVSMQFPGALRSPLAHAMGAASALAILESSDPDTVVMRYEAREHAAACLRAADGWTVETLGHNIESTFGLDLRPEECDEIARAAIAAARGDK